MPNREQYYDFLRGFGMLLIILAHIQSPAIVHQIRCFDVPLLLFVSGLCMAGGNIPHSFLEYLAFVKRRSARLVIPVFIFMPLYFIVLYVLSLVGFDSVPSYTPSEMIGTLLFFDKPSIGYMWIIRVQLLIMLISPLLIILSRYGCKMSDRVYGGGKLLLIVLCAFAILILSEIVVHYFIPYLSDYKAVRFIIYETLPFCLAYSVPFYIGLVTGHMDGRYRFVLFLFFFVATIIGFCYYGYFLVTPALKYPPHALYILYGVTCSLLLMVLQKFLKKISGFKPLLFIGQNSMWIYLWHIPYAVLAMHLFDFFIYRLFFVVMATLITVGIQYKMVNNSSLTLIGVKKYLVG